jgi:uncharacterized membrane protein
MAANAVRFVLLMLVSLLVGTMVGIWAGFNPANLSPSAYVEQQQNAIAALNVLLPVVGAICIVLTLLLAYLSTGDPRSRYMLVTAAALLVVAGLVTRFSNQPINAIVVTWNAQAPAANWQQLRDSWWHWHVVRSLAGVGALALLVLAVLGARRTPGLANVV